MPPEALLQIETDGELASRAAVASSFFLALFRASRSGLACKAAACECGVDRGSLNSAPGCIVLCNALSGCRDNACLLVAIEPGTETVT